MGAWVKGVIRIIARRLFGQRRPLWTDPRDELPKHGRPVFALIEFEDRPFCRDIARSMWMDENTDDDPKGTNSEGWYEAPINLPCHLLTKNTVIGWMEFPGYPHYMENPRPYFANRRPKPTPKRKVRLHA